MGRSWFRRLAAPYRQPEGRLSRREALKRSLQVASAVLLSESVAHSAAPAAGKRVLVVGAGFAGAACAYELAAVGYDVTVFEARERAGGRVFSSTNVAPTRTVELGGELIGSNHPLWVAYAKKFNLDLREIEDDDTAIPVRLGGKTYAGKAAEELWEAIDKGHEQLAKQSAAVEYKTPWTTENAAALDAETFAHRIQSLDTTAVAKQAILTEFMMDMATSPQKMSCLGLLTIIAAHGGKGYWDETEVFRCAEGNARLAERLLIDVGKDKVRFDQPVVSIKVTDTGARLRLANGEEIEADDVVLTVPPSTWSKIDIKPAIPDALKPQMGQAVKHMAVLRERYWDEEKTVVDSMGDDLLGMTWEGTEGQEGAGPAVLTSFVGGDPVKPLRALSAAERKAQMTAGFEAIAPGFEEQLLRDVFMDWVGDPYSLCGYSCPAPGQVTTVWKALDASRGRLHFAGEHTAMGFAGFMEGGLQSGAKIAKRIAQRDGVARG